MHFVKVENTAGIETHFTEFVRRARTTHPDWTQDWLNPRRAAHPYFAAELASTVTHTVRAKYAWRVRLPSRPAAIRRWHCRRALRRARTDVLMIWNRSAKTGFALDAFRADRCVHWEHGAAWEPGRERERREYFRRVGSAIANSHAAERVLRLLWEYSGDVHVCRNALRPSLKPAAAVCKSYPSGHVTLGVAARLRPVKGIALVLHAVKSLAAGGLDVELRVAGTGPELERLQGLARSLGIDGRVHFQGAVRDMGSFYRSIDCLVHPPLTEAFGLVAIEAAAMGCPVIAAAIDGLPEAVADGVSGYCLTPTMPLADYAGLGGGPTADLPALVYDPARDALVAPPFVDPVALADAVARLFASASAFEDLSRSASDYVLRRFDFDRHVDEVMTVAAASLRT
jgi:glycosyltransferase involved in cell wall biosynthesis